MDVVFTNFVNNKAKGKVVLAIGCAGYLETGSFGRQYKELKKVASKLYGLDNNKNFIKKFNREKNLFYGDLNHFDWFGNIPKDIKLIVITEVLEHLRCPIATLEYIKKNKPKKCQILLSVPNGGSFGRLLHGLLKTHMFVFQDRFHFQLYNKKTIENTCKEAGLKITEIYPYVWSRSQSFLKWFPNLCSGFFVLCK